VGPQMHEGNLVNTRGFSGGSMSDSSGRRKPPKEPISPTGRRVWAGKTAFNKYNPDELLSQLVEVLDKYELEEAVDAVKKLTPTVQKAWRSRDR
jgi:hypothetical protein